MGNLKRLIHTLAICVTIHNVEDKPTVILHTTLFITIVVSHIQRIGRQRGLQNREMYTVVQCVRDTGSSFLPSCTRYVCTVNTFSRV